MAQQPLEDLLVRSGLLTDDGLARACALQRLRGGDLGQHLLELRLLDEETLVRALASVHGLPAVAIEPTRLNRDVVRQVPRATCERFDLVAFRHDAQQRILYVAVADPTDSAGPDEVRRLTGCDLAVSIAQRTSIRSAVELCFSESAFPPPAATVAGAPATSPAPGAAPPPLSRHTGPHRPRPARAPGITQTPEPIGLDLEPEHARGDPTLERPVMEVTSVAGDPAVPPGDEDRSALHELVASRPETIPVEVQPSDDGPPDQLLTLERAVGIHRMVLERLLRLLVQKGLITREEVRKLLEQP